MRIIDINCPHCGGKLHLTEGKNDCFCEYCGSHLYIDDETRRTTNDFKDIKNVWPEWSVVEFLGKGSFGSVYKIERKKGDYSFYSALKVIHIPVNEEELEEYYAQGLDEQTIRQLYMEQVHMLEQEIVIMESLKSAANVVSIEDHYVKQDRGRIGWTFYIRMELLESLSSYLKRVKKISNKEVVKMGIDITNALETCEEVHIIHRDVKPGNIFRGKYGDYKLGDFGIARELKGNDNASTVIGTPTYEAPEIVSGKPYNHTVDIYALGIVLYTFLNHGRKPFLPPYPQPITSKDKEEAFSRRLAGERFPRPDEADYDLSAIILKACEYDPHKRYQKAAEFGNELKKYELAVPLNEHNTENTTFPSYKKKETRKRSLLVPIVLGLLSVTIVGVVISYVLKKHYGMDAYVTRSVASPGSTSEDTGTTDGEGNSSSLDDIPDWKSVTSITDADVGDVVQFGEYEQDNNLDNGSEVIEWYVIKVDGKKKLLLSKYALTGKEEYNYYWGNSNCRSFLNESFYANSFTEDEKKQISLTRNQDYTETIKLLDDSSVTVLENDSFENVFLLSVKETADFFGIVYSYDSERYIPEAVYDCRPTKYATHMDVLSNRQGSCVWRTRSIGEDEKWISEEPVSDSKFLNYPKIENTGIRPALWVYTGSVYNDGFTVRRAQAALNKAGYSCGIVNGVLETNTRKAIYQFQSDHNLETCGLITVELMEKLNLS